jgi:hypothetical protein
MIRAGPVRCRSFQTLFSTMLMRTFKPASAQKPPRA